MTWQNLYQSCLLETDSEKLEKLVVKLEEAIVLRYRDLDLEPNSDESRALKQAAQKLLELKVQKLGRTDPAKVAHA
jgi:hypothetical protein